MEVPGGKKSLRKGQAVLLVTDGAPDAAGDSTESVVLQCGDVEDGEEVMRTEPPVMMRREFSLKKMQLASLQQPEHSDGACDNGEDEDGGDAVYRPSDFRAWLSNLTNDSAYWSTGGHVRMRRCTAPNVGEAVMVDKPSVKRKHEEIAECGPASESELDEGTDSDDESASSSDSDGSESEYEQSNRRASGNNKRRRGAEERIGTSPWTDESTQVGLSRRRSSAAANCDDELKEMQLLLELQLKASEKREAGMKQRMETMMDMMSRHMGNVEKRVSTLEVRAQPQEQILERINVKLEKVMEQFSTLNENLSILSACLSKDLESQ